MLRTQERKSLVKWLEGKRFSSKKSVGTIFAEAKMLVPMLLIDCTEENFSNCWKMSNAANQSGVVWAYRVKTASEGGLDSNLLALDEEKIIGCFKKIGRGKNQYFVDDNSMIRILKIPDSLDLIGNLRNYKILRGVFIRISQTLCGFIQ